jgi:hypothetical protein
MNVIDTLCGDCEFIERPRVTDLEFKWVLEQMTGAGYIKWRDSETCRLTNAGIDYALELERQLGVFNVTILEMLHQVIDGIVKEEEEAGSALHD